MQPPDTEPWNRPSAPITIWPPVGTGAEPQVSMTVAMATLPSRAIQSRAAINTSISSRAAVVADFAAVFASDFADWVGLSAMAGSLRERDGVVDHYSRSHARCRTKAGDSNANLRCRSRFARHIVQA